MYSDRKFINYCEIDKYRYLAVDENGNLFLIALKPENKEINNNNISGDGEYTLVFQFLGEVNYASTLTYLDNNVIFIGSEKGNSQLIKITKSVTNNTSRPFIEIIEEYENLAPISDFCLMNNTNDEGSTEILCVSGTQKSCCLKTIRKGSSINIEGEIPFVGVKSLFSVIFNDVNSSNMLIDENESNKNILIFVNFIDRTTLVNFDNNSFSVSNFFNDNIFLKQPTLFAKNFTYENENFIIQITSSFIIIFDESLNLIVSIPTVINPILFKLKKKSGFLYIYNKNNLLIRYNLFNIGKFF
jgi:hypothetical protein